jgi:hypothetical protein
MLGAIGLAGSGATERGRADVLALQGFTRAALGIVGRFSLIAIPR